MLLMLLGVQGVQEGTLGAEGREGEKRLIILNLNTHNTVHEGSCNRRWQPIALQSDASVVNVELAKKNLKENNSCSMEHIALL